jgi:DNA (cytosine-5)-methyltransferase 1
MNELTKREVFKRDAIDVLVGGTPCQSFSIAGMRKGLDDPRGNLALVFLQIADRARPRWLVWENVDGIRSLDGGFPFWTFLTALRELGYGFAYRVLDAQYFGLAQRRARVFVVGGLGDWRGPAAVLFERASLSGNPPPSRAKGKGVAQTVTASSHRSGGATGGNNPGLVNAVIEAPDVAACLTTRCGGGRQDSATETFIAHTLRGGGFDASEDGTGRGTPLVPIPFDTTQITSKHNRSCPEPGDPCHALAASAASAAAPAVAGGLRVRRLTPRECERLQGFPDDYTLVPYRGGWAKDGPRYEAIGNSMPVPVMAWIGRRIAMIEQVTP